jgi:hypothetical protein
MTNRPVVLFVCISSGERYLDWKLPDPPVAASYERYGRAVDPLRRGPPLLGTRQDDSRLRAGA